MSAPRGSAILAALKTAGIEFVVALPDIVTSDGLLWPLARQNDIRLVRICKEDEGIGICAGLGFAGRRSILMMQQTGLMDSVNALRAVGVEYEQPIAMLVGLQGKEAGVLPSKSAKVSVSAIEPILDALGVDHVLIETQDDEAKIALAFERAFQNSRPVCVLIGTPPLADGAAP